MKSTDTLTVIESAVVGCIAVWIAQLSAVAGVLFVLALCWALSEEAPEDDSEDTIAVVVETEEPEDASITHEDD